MVKKGISNASYDNDDLEGVIVSKGGHRLEGHRLAALDIADNKARFLAGLARGRDALGNNRDGSVAHAVPAAFGNHGGQEIERFRAYDRRPPAPGRLGNGLDNNGVVVCHA